MMTKNDSAVNKNMVASTDRICLKLFPMTLEDIPDVRAVEKLCFDEFWPEGSFEKEISNSKTSRFILARTQEGRLAGYMGAWFILDEAHITTIGVDPEFRGRRIGKFLVCKMFEKALNEGCRWSTLEVNVRNTPARNIYEHFGFTKIGQRKDYYASGDDAVVMWAGNIQGQVFRERLDKIRLEWEEKICLSSE